MSVVERGTACCRRVVQFGQGEPFERMSMRVVTCDRGRADALSSAWARITSPLREVWCVALGFLMAEVTVSSKARKERASMQAGHSYRTARRPESTGREHLRSASQH